MLVSTNENCIKLELEVRRLAEEFPNAIYRNRPCLYNSGIVENGPETEGCIFGQALSILHPEDKESFDRTSCFETINNISELIERLYPDMKEDGRACEWFYRVQVAQDTGSTWLNAVKSADIL